MRTKREVLKARYAVLLRKFGVWAGVLVLGASMFVPAATEAVTGQLTSRSLTLSSSAVSAVTTYAFGFTIAQTGNIGAVKFELCDSPLEQTSCSNAGNSSGVSFTSNSASLSGTTGTGFSSGFSAGTGTPPAPTANTFWITRTAASVNSGTAVTATFINVRNPSAANKSYYAKVTTYSDANGTTEVDFGAIAVSTANQISLAANVQESLTFCVGTSGTGCGGGGLTGTSVNLGTGSDNVLSTSTPSGGTSLMAADTNATTGYVITYITTSPGGTGGTACAGSLSSSNDCITDFGGTAGTFTAGTSNFGINLKANTTPSLGAGVSGSGSGAAVGQYNIANNYAFQSGLTPRTVASAAGPTLSNLYTVSYVAQAGNTTKPGAYSATFTWVCTGTF